MRDISAYQMLQDLEMNGAASNYNLFRPYLEQLPRVVCDPFLKSLFFDVDHVNRINGQKISKFEELLSFPLRPFFVKDLCVTENPHGSENCLTQSQTDKCFNLFMSNPIYPHPVITNIRTIAVPQDELDLTTSETLADLESSDFPTETSAQTRFEFTVDDGSIGVSSDERYEGNPAALVPLRMFYQQLQTRNLVSVLMEFVKHSMQDDRLNDRFLSAIIEDHFIHGLPFELMRRRWEIPSLDLILRRFETAGCVMLNDPTFQQCNLVYSVGRSLEEGKSRRQIAKSLKTNERHIASYVNDYQSFKFWLSTAVPEEVKNSFIPSPEIHRSSVPVPSKKAEKRRASPSPRQESKSAGTEPSPYEVLYQKLESRDLLPALRKTLLSLSPHKGRVSDEKLSAILKDRMLNGLSVRQLAEKWEIPSMHHLLHRFTMAGCILLRDSIELDQCQKINSVVRSFENGKKVPTVTQYSGRNIKLVAEVYKAALKV